MTERTESAAEKLARVLSGGACGGGKGSSDERKVSTLWDQCKREDAAKLVIPIITSWSVAPALRAAVEEIESMQASTWASDALDVLRKHLGPWIGEEKA